MPENPGKPRVNPFFEALEEDFVVFRTESHVIQLNKFAVYRPHLILHTKDFALQTDPLDLSDFEAACAVLSQLQDPYVVFYNCGLDAGSSQSHKHLQLIPKPPKDEFVLFPDLQSDYQQNSGISNGDEQNTLTFSQPPTSSHVLFHCDIAYFTKDATSKQKYNVYQCMLDTPHPDYLDLTAHNMIMTECWVGFVSFLDVVD